MGERTPQDYAIEHAGYMAKDAERLIAAVNDLALAESEHEDGTANKSDVDAARNAVSEAQTALANGIYEFRKRRDRASAPASLQEGMRTALIRKTDIDALVEAGWLWGGRVLSAPPPAGAQQAVAEDVQRARLIAQAAQKFAEDRTHIGDLVYVNDLVWALGILAAPAAAQGAQREQAGAVDPSDVRRFLEKLVTANRKSGAMFPQIADEIEADDKAHQRILKLIDFYHPIKAAAPQAALAAAPAPEAAPSTKEGERG